MTEPIDGAEKLFAKPQLEAVIRKIKTYVSLKKEEGQETKEGDESPLEGFNINIPERVTVGTEGELKAPDLEEMKNDFLVLGRAMRIMEEGGNAIPGTLWSPVRDMVESYVASQVAPVEVEERYAVLKPVLDLFEENAEALKSNMIIGDSVEDWIGTVDPKLGEMMKKGEEAQKNAAV